MAAMSLPPEPEVWKPVVGYEGFYSVSSLGRIRRERSITCTKAGRILAQTDRGNGYPCVALSREGRARVESVHRIVAAAFLGACPPRYEVNHIDGVKANNAVTNLEYVSSSANQRHAYRTALQSAAGEKNGQAKLTPDAVRSIRARSTGRRGEQAALAREFGVSPTTIRGVLSRRVWPTV